MSVPEDAANATLNETVTGVFGVNDPDGSTVRPWTSHADTTGMHTAKITTVRIISFVNPFIINLTRTTDRYLLRTYSIFSL